MIEIWRKKKNRRGYRRKGEGKEKGEEEKRRRMEIWSKKKNRKRVLGEREEGERLGERGRREEKEDGDME